MKHLYKLAFILLAGAGFALAQAGAGQDTTPSTPSQSGAQQLPDNSQGTGGAAKAQSEIQMALRKQMAADADNISVSVTRDNKIRLSGAVSSDSEKQQIEQIAHSAAPDVEIINRINVSSAPGDASNPSSSKPPVLRMIAYQQSGRMPQDQPGQTRPLPQTQDPTDNSAAQQPSSPASNGSQADSSDVQDKVQKAIQQDNSLAGSNINVAVSGNKVELTGTVASKDQKKTAKELAETNAGGMKVVDHLKVSNTEAAPSTPSTPPKN